MTTVKVALGRRLFYDTRFSGNGTFACASASLPCASQPAAAEADRRVDRVDRAAGAGIAAAVVVVAGPGVAGRAGS